MEFFIYFNLLIICPSIIFVFLLSKINKKTVRNLYRSGKEWIYAICGIIGVPIHELSHAIGHVIFGHQIDEIVLYDPDGYEDNETIGHVNFSYNPESVYQSIGLFFAGIAPIIGGSVIIFLLMRFLVPGVYESLALMKIDSINLIDIFKNLYTVITTTIESTFTNYDNIFQLIIFWIIAFSISINMDLSPADFENATVGFVIIEIILLVIAIFLGLYKVPVNINIILLIASYMISVFSIELAFCLIFFSISYVIKALLNQNFAA